MRGLLAGLVLLLIAALPARADDRGDAQSLVDNSTLAVQEMLTTGDPAAIADMQRMLRRARAVLVCPRIFRAGFILGGEGGGQPGGRADHAHRLWCLLMLELWQREHVDTTTPAAVAA